MTIAQEFITKLQNATQQRFWEVPPAEPTFLDVLKQYATYYQALNSDEERTKIAAVFWEHIKSIGTPIIEKRADGQSEVYFLYRRDNAKYNTKKELYLQGDFHGYGSTLKSSQELSRLSDTDIMYRSNTIPKDALVTYYYVQLDPIHGDKKATDFYGDLAYQPPSFFYDVPNATGDDKKPVAKTKEELKAADELFYGADSVLVDELSKYRKAFDPKCSFFCADPVQDISHLSLQFNKDNPRLVEKFFLELRNQATLNIVSKSGEIEDYPADPEYLRTCSRSISVFVPAGAEIDQVIIINDGRYYQLGYANERIYEILGKNTAIIFISPEKVLEYEAKNKGIKFEPSDALTGMGERTVDYKYKVDEYAEFIHKKLLPYLVSRGIKTPDDPKKRVLLGSSLSGTASLYMGLTYPEWFGNIVVQSPSIGNKRILKEIIDKGIQPLPVVVFLSCGKFESPVYAKNLNIPFAEELEARLGIKLHIYPHGHQIEGWSRQLEHALPALGLSNRKDALKPMEYPSASSQTIFSRPQQPSSTISDDESDTKILVYRKKGS